MARTLVVGSYERFLLGFNVPENLQVCVCVLARCPQALP
jgi:hypothetical protein